jgi:hypothetical protein
VNFGTLIRDFQKLEPGFKFVFFGTALAVISVFLPWFQIDQLQAEEGMRLSRIPEVSNGFGIFPVFGLLSILFSSFCFLVLIQSMFGAKKTFGFPPGKLWLFFGGEAMFAFCIALFVFSSEVQADSTAQIRFGIFATLIAHTLIVFGGYLTEKVEQKDQVIEDFMPPPSSVMNNINIRPESPSISSQQLSFSDSHERDKSVLRR